MSKSVLVIDPKEIFICQECKERYGRGEVDGEIDRKI